MLLRIAVLMAPGDVPVIAGELAGPGVLAPGRAPQSIAFFKRPAGIERLCSGVTNRTRPPPRSRFEAVDARRQFGFEVLIVERQIVDWTKVKSNWPRRAGDRLGELAVDANSRRLLPTTTAILNLS